MADNFSGEDNLDDVAKAILNVPEEKEETPKPRPEGEDDVTPDEEPDDTGEESSEEGEGGSEEVEETSDEVDEIEDIDEVEVDVTVDGKTVPVKLKELKAKYSGAVAIESRLQEATEAKNKVMNVGSALYTTLSEQSQRLQRLDAILQEQQKPPIDMEELRKTKPGEYLLERERQREVEDRRRQIYAEQERIARQQNELDYMAYQEYAEVEAKTLVQRMPEFSDPVKSKELITNISEAINYYGLDPQEVNSVSNHRYMMVLADAAKYRKMLSAKSGKTESKKIEKLKVRPLVRAGAAKASSPMSSTKKDDLAAIKRAKSTGHPEDVAKLLMVRAK